MSGRSIFISLPLAVQARKGIRELAFNTLKQAQARPVQFDRIFFVLRASVSTGLAFAPRHAWITGVFHFDDRCTDCCLAFGEIDSDATRQGSQQGNFFNSPHSLPGKPAQKEGPRYGAHFVETQIFAVVPSHSKKLFKLMFYQLPLQNREDSFLSFLGFPLAICNFHGVHDCCNGAKSLYPRCPVRGLQEIPVICGAPRVDGLNQANNSYESKQGNNYLFNAFHGIRLDCKKDIVA